MDVGTWFVVPMVWRNVRVLVYITVFFSPCMLCCAVHAVLCWVATGRGPISSESKIPVTPGERGWGGREGGEGGREVVRVGTDVIYDR